LVPSVNCGPCKSDPESSMEEGDFPDGPNGMELQRRIQDKEMEVNNGHAQA
jgi:hypothetical protein